MATTTFSILSWLVGLPDGGAVLVEFKAAFDFSIPSSLAGTKVTVGTNPTSTATYTINKNGSSIGTIQIATDGTVTLAGAGAAFAAASNDVFQLVAMFPQDTTLSDVSINILATR